MILFEQDGCPYCKELILTNFSQKTIATRAKEFLAVSLNSGRPRGDLDDGRNSQRKVSRLS